MPSYVRSWRRKTRRWQRSKLVCRHLSFSRERGDAEQFRLAEYALLEPRDRFAFEVDQGRPDAALERCFRVAPKVIVVPEVDGLEQENELVVADQAVGHLRIHTRARDRSLSTSSGLAM